MSTGPTLQIRFVINHPEHGTAYTQEKRKNNKFAQVVVHQVAISYAQTKLADLKAMISTQITDLVARELQHVAEMYKKFIVGREGQRATRNTLTTLAGETDSEDNRKADYAEALRGTLPDWAPRKDRYLRRKLKAKGHTRWFQYDGLLGRDITATSWTEYFGPIRVTVVPKKSVDYADRAPTSQKPFAETGIERFGYASVYVSAFGNITPSMLSGDGRKNGLLSLVAAVNPELAFHLGGSSRYTPYRGTLEPFIKFAIYRSIPAAVNRAFNS